MEEYPSTDSRMPLERPTELTDAFKYQEGRVVAPDDKSISTGFLEALEAIKEKIMKSELFSQFYDGKADWQPTSNLFEFLISGAFLVVVATLSVALIWGICKTMGWKW